MTDAPAGLDTALAMMRQGQHAPAEQVCRRILDAEPRDFGASHLLGVLLLLRGEPGLAEQRIADAIAINPGVAGAHYNRGNALLALGRAQEAITCFDQALHLKPDFAQALCNRGNAQNALNWWDLAIASFKAALAIRPGITEAHNGLGNAQLAMGRGSEALASFDRAIALDQRHPGAHNNRGSAMFAMGRLEDALASFDAAISLAPDTAEAHDNRGMVLRELGRFDAAIASHDRAIALRPGFARAYCRRAHARRGLGQLQKALSDCEKAIELQPGLAEAFNCRGIVHHDSGRLADAKDDFGQAVRLDSASAEAFNNLGNVLHDLGQPQQALDSLRQAIALRPDYVEALNNRGMILQDLRRFDEARQAYDAAIHLRPGHAESYKRRATLALLQGDYGKGWKDYETSLQAARRGSPGPLHGIPYWTGQPLQGKSILLSEPSGFGDAIQFLRYVPMLVAKGADVAFFGHDRLFRLLASCPWPLRLLSEQPLQGAFDYHSQLWSLPNTLGTQLDSIPDCIPYLFAEPGVAARWSPLLSKDRFNIGICWQGKPDRKIDIGRSIPLQAFRPLAQVPGVQLISLQKHHGLEQLDDLPGDMKVLDPGPEFDAGEDAFIDSAGLMRGLDLVVSSDTAIVHLAGALGRPTWVGLKYTPEWRWMLERIDSPWYPTLELFRQARPGDWSEVFETMAAGLRKRI